LRIFGIYGAKLN